MTESSYNINPLQSLPNAAGLSQAHDNERRKNNKRAAAKDEFGTSLEKEKDSDGSNSKSENDSGELHIDCCM